MPLLNSSRKRSSAAFNVIVLDGDDNDQINENEANFEEDVDDEDLNYAVNLKISKTQQAITTNTTTGASLLFTRKQSIAKRIDQICEFAHVLMHCLLYKINYYNKKIHFEKCIKYNIIIYKCKSEIVCEYITNCVESMRLILYSQFNLDNDIDLNANANILAIGLAVLKGVNNDESEFNMSNLLIKRYTLQIENMSAIAAEDDSESDSNSEATEDNSEVSDDDEENVDNKQTWQFRDSLLKCLYSPDIHYPPNFKWQIQLRTSRDKMIEISHKEDLFKLFAWRSCDSVEITAITNRVSDPTETEYLNHISVKPIKTFENHYRNANIRMQLFMEQPIKSTQQLIRNKKF